MMSHVGRTFLIGILSSGASGCGFLFTHGPPQEYERLDYFSCTESNAGPIIDVVWGGLNVLGAIAIMADPDAYEDTYEIRAGAGVAVGLTWGAISGAAAVVGFNKTSRCREAKRSVALRDGLAPDQRDSASRKTPALTGQDQDIERGDPGLIRGAWLRANPPSGVAKSGLEHWVGTIEGGDESGVPRITIRLFEWAQVGSDMGTAVYWYDSGACTYDLTLVAIEGGERVVQQISESPRCVPLGDILFTTTGSEIVGVWKHMDGTHWFSALLEIE